jgi:hypothetical protein
MSYVSMLVCMHICAYVGMYVYMRACMCVSMNVCYVRDVYMYVCYLRMLSLYVNAAYVHSCTYVCMYACLFMHARKEHGCISYMVVCVKHVCMCICSQTEYVMYNTVCTSLYMCIRQIGLVPYYVHVCMCMYA